jgi:valyl-tRNA synthetase
MVLDAKGQKMSKSKGNVIDPLTLTDKYGTDAFRIGMIIGNTPGTSLSLSEDKIRAYKNYANKLWNITRFVLTNTIDIKYERDFKNYTDQENKLIKEIDDLIKEISKEMDEYKFYLVGEKIYQYTWTRFADVILEESKNIFESGTNEEKLSRKQFLLQNLEKILKILHPFMPFVTEEIWSMMPIENKKLLFVENWPLHG